MGLSDDIAEMSPERYARAAKRAAELAVELSDKAGQLVPDHIRALANSTEAQIAAKRRVFEHDSVQLAADQSVSPWIGEPPYASEWSEHMRSLLGKWVHVIIDKDKPVIVTGKLLSFNEGGEVAIRHDDGFVTWAWPALEAEVADDPRCKHGGDPAKCH